MLGILYLFAVILITFSGLLFCSNITELELDIKNAQELYFYKFLFCSPLG